MKKIVTTAAALALLASAALAQDVVRLGTEGAYPPYNFIDDSGEVAGFERELGDELCARAGLTCTWVINDWDSIIPNLTSGNYDAIMAGMSITEERAQIISFTQNYYPPTASAYLALSDEADIEGGVIAAQVNTIQAGYIAASGATLVEFATPDETIAAVRNGQADAVFADFDYLKPFADEDPDLRIVGERVPLGGGVGMGLRQGDDELRQKFDDAIGAMKTDGSLNALLVTWFGDDTQTYD